MLSLLRARERATTIASFGRAITIEGERSIKKQRTNNNNESLKIKSNNFTKLYFAIAKIYL